MSKKVKTLADSEWVITIQLETGGEIVYGPIEARYTDSYAAPCPENVGLLLAGRLAELVDQTRKRKGKSD